MRRLKIKVVGDASVGKTCFLCRWHSECYSPQDGGSDMLPKTIPPVQDSYFTNFSYERVSYIVTYWDTCTLRSTSELDISKLRPLEYRETDVFLVCFDVSSPSSFQNISTIWVPELKHYMPGTPILVVGNKKDLRIMDSDVSACLVSPSKGQELAERLGTQYFENSAQTGEGIKEVIEAAVQLAVTHRNAETTKKTFFQRKKTPPTKLLSHYLEPPALPFPGPIPSVMVEDSTFAADMKRLLDQSTFADVTFQFANASVPIQAHRIALCLGSYWFRDLFLRQDNFRKSISHPSIEIDMPSNKSDSFNSDTDLADSRTYIFAQPKPFLYVLEFLYTGQLSLAENVDRTIISSMISILKNVKIPELEDICENILRDESFLNNSIFKFVKEKRWTTAREVFLNQACLSDVIFVIDGQRVFAHKAIVTARSEVMAAMLGGSFCESTDKEVEVKDTSVQTFLGMLEFMYTDRLHELESIEADKQLLILADRFCLSGLRTLCEQRIAEQLKSLIKQKLKLSNETCEQVIDVFVLSRVHNASQLHRCCGHIISTNYTDFEFSEDLALLSPDDVKLVMDHRWPPPSYLKQLEEYKRKTSRN